MDGLALGAWPVVPGLKVFDCAVGPLRGVLPGSANGPVPDGAVGDTEGLVADGLFAEGLAAEGVPDGLPEELAPEPVEPLELPELLCAIATSPDNNKTASIAADVISAADVTFIVLSTFAPHGSTHPDGARSRRFCNSRERYPHVAAVFD